MSRAFSISKHFDQIAILLSAVCIVHCLAVPVAVAVLPILAVSFGNDSHFHLLMLWLVVPTSVAGLGLGFRRHGRHDVLILGAAGIALLGAAAFWGHRLWPISAEVTISVFGSLLLGSGHWLNFRAVMRTHRHA